MIDSHRQQEVIEVLIRQPLEVRGQVEEVSVDMWGRFPKVIEGVFPNAQVVIDRVHVIKTVNKDLNKLRRATRITDRRVSGNISDQYDRQKSSGQSSRIG